MNLRITLGFVGAVLIGHSSAVAQTIRGLVVGPSDAPVAGIVVQLVDSASHVTTQVLTNTAGVFRLGGSPGAYRLRALRIGYRPTLSDLISLKKGAELEYRFVLSNLPIVLETVRVSDRSACHSIGDSTTAAYRAWEQARTALTATQLTASAQNILATTLTYDRTLAADGLHLLHETVDTRSGYVKQPWVGAAPDSLRRNGYIVGDNDGGTTYYAPGIETLLADSFVEDHCFHLIAGQDRIGVAFEPTANRRDVPEVHGTMWLNRASAGLERLEYGYANARPDEESLAGGEVGFVRMRDGTWAVSEWHIRMPVIQRVDGGFRGYESRVTAIKVRGGELLLAKRGTDTLWSHLPSLVGTVRDSTIRLPDAGHIIAALTATFSGVVLVDSTRQPIAGAEVVLPELARTTFTNASGAFSLPDVPAGEQHVVVRHIGYGPLDTRVTFPGGETLHRSVFLTRATQLDSVVVTASVTDRALSDFEENRRVGLGHFFTRADLAKRENLSTADVLAEVPDIRLVRGLANHTWVRSGRSPVSLSGAGRPDARDKAVGAPAANCYALVYLDNALVFGNRKGVDGTFEPLFDINSISVSQIEAIEYYSGAADTPARYSRLDSACGVVVIHTRRSP